MGDGTAGPTLMGVDAGFGRPVEAALLGRAGQGDRQAQGQLYRHYADAMYRLALRTLGCAAEAEEVVHDAFIAALRGLTGYRGDAPFGYWLRRITVREAVRHLRRAPPESECIDALPLVDEQSGWPQEPAALEQALGQLSKISRSVLWLHLVEGYGHEEIGQLFGRSVSFSKSQVARSLARLRELLQVEEGRA
ncbi:MAG: RNA polymerase sigma factor [Xanthomonadales bacterium]|nr:RNA polymerase sigma factor [Xanthomonadales bacterium]